MIMLTALRALGWIRDARDKSRLATGMPFSALPIDALTVFIVPYELVAAQMQQTISA